ncbi:MAG: NYN domain-containing protein [Candidatus Omnitrophica bacterium]|nr:NYN domain-containing protein [Candidatus Omnitrophota bacterium]
MSLQYVIDACNLINHPAFKPAGKSTTSIQHTLADFIKLNRLSGSKNNKVVLVFDGYPPRAEEAPFEDNLYCLFSRAKEADELIKEMVERSASPKNIVVVSDDKEVRLVSRLLHAQVCGVEEFICGRKNNKRASAVSPAAEDFKLSYAKMQKIDEEMKKRWLR